MIITKPFPDTKEHNGKAHDDHVEINPTIVVDDPKDGEYLFIFWIEFVIPNVRVKHERKKKQFVVALFEKRTLVLTIQCQLHQKTNNCHWYTGSICDTVIKRSHIVNARD